MKVANEEELMDEMDQDIFPVLTLNRYPSIMPSKSKLQELAAQHLEIRKSTTTSVIKELKVSDKTFAVPQLPPRRLPDNNPESTLNPRKRKLGEVEKSDFVESPKKRLRGNLNKE